MRMIEINPSAFLRFLLVGTFILIIPSAVEFILDRIQTDQQDFDIRFPVKHFIKCAEIIFFISALIHLPLLFLREVATKIFGFFLLIFFYLFSLLDMAHVIIFRSQANESSFHALFSTHNTESLEFILDYSGWPLMGGVLLFISFSCLTYYLLRKYLNPKIIKVLSIPIIILLFISGITFYKNRDAKYFHKVSTFQFFSSLINYRREIDNFNFYAQKFPISARAKKYDYPQTHIIVIGESTSKYHMQLYGYGRRTNPQLHKIKDRLILLDEVKSSSVHTVSSLMDIFFPEEHKNNPYKCSLIDILNHAGFKTYWISNQPYLGKNETIVSAISKRTNRQIFLNPVFSQQYDEDLIPSLRKCLQDTTQNKIIFVHLMGTHLSYQNRYPSSFNIFNTTNFSPFGLHADAFINHYDNAVLYNDHVVSEMIRIIDSVRGMNSLLYFADHGDEVYDFRDFHGHSEHLLSKYMNSVPFIFFPSKLFEEVKMEKLTQLRINSNNRFSLKNLSHTLQDLFEIETAFYDPKKSYLSTNTKKQADNAHPESGNLSYQRYFPNFAERIWVHRVNTIERLRIVQDKFQGMELDVVFENGKLDVRHPPAVSIGLSIDDYFSNVKNIGKHYFWIDLKEYTDGKEHELIQYLNKITNRFGNKKNLIIESPDQKILNLFDKADFLTTRYLPDISSIPYENSEKEMYKLAEDLKRNNTFAISQSLDNYTLMADHFGWCNKLLWISGIDWKNEREHARILNLIKKDSTIKICLVGYKTAGWR